MDDKLERFKKRQASKQRLEKREHLSISAKEMVNEHLNSKVQKELVFNTEQISLTETKQNEEDAKELLKSINKTYDKKRMSLLVDDCKSTILDNIIKPFGIAKYIVAKHDKKGGNVDTVHNVRQNIYATDKEKVKAEGNPKYNSHEYHSHENYKEKNRNASIQKKNNTLTDEYTNDIIKDNEPSDLEHTISANEIYSDRGRGLAELSGVELANAKSNLNHTSPSINRSKREKSVTEFVEKTLEGKREKRQQEINDLSSKSDLSDREHKKLKKNTTLEKVDKDLIMKKDKEARAEYENKVNKKYYKSGKFVKNTTKTSTAEGAKMGLQQAVGIVLKELTESIFDEISDIWQDGFKGKNTIDKTFFSVLKERLLRIGNNVLSEWEDVVKAFGEGFFSGFLSNIVTVLINIFTTTGKRLVRIIREGFFSLLKAIKLLFFPPENMSIKEAAHEATKLIVAGLAVTGGIVLEQYLDTLLKTIPFADMISTVLIGIVTGLATSLLIFMLDKLDIFGVNKEKQYGFIIQELDRITNNSFEEAEQILKGLEIQTI
jgi:regulator of extracellular matrix RemA (YlzA/DUF370 family)